MDLLRPWWRRLIGTPAPPAPRRVRDWVVDSVAVLLSLAYAALTGLLAVIFPEVLDETWGTVWYAWTDIGVGAAASAALWWRRRRPVLLAVVFLLLIPVISTLALAMLMQLFTVAVHRRFVVAAGFAVGMTAVVAVAASIAPDPEVPTWGIVVGQLALAAIMVLWGAVVRSRRQLLVSLRDRAERAEAEQRLRVTRARSLERTRIAREMHDVLAHRISLLSLHAGALEVRPDAPPDQVATAAAVIRAGAHQAMEDLREVIGVLREPGAEPGAPQRPQPTLARLPDLVAESRAAGMTVRLRLAVQQPDALPEAVGRTAYRVVQEGLTNARKHAAGAVVDVAVGGAPGAGLTVAVRNPRPLALAGPALPGAGTGLVGLGERATLAGGTLRHGYTPDGAFELVARLPWPS